MSRKIKPIKLILIKENQLAISMEIISCYCDFCGQEKGKMSFVSSCEDECQICFNCIKGLYKLLPTQLS